jgi:protein phosphatase
MRLKASGLSDVGQARSHNEDYFVIDPERSLYLVADGMGGHGHGEVASRLAVFAIRDFLRRAPDVGLPDGTPAQLRPHSHLLRRALRRAHGEVLGAIRRNGDLLGMGTTVVGMLVEQGVAAIAHVGDSRAYRLRQGQLRLLTQDHTWVGEQVAAGVLSESEARQHPLKNVVTRALGGDREVNVDVQEVQVRPGDRYLLCSDGLSTVLDDDEIASCLGRQSSSAEELCRTLVDRAKARGGRDDITVITLLAEAGSHPSDPDASYFESP